MRRVAATAVVVVASVIALAAVIWAAPRVYADPASILFEPWLLGAALVFAYVKVRTLAHDAKAHLRSPK